MNHRANGAAGTDVVCRLVGADRLTCQEKVSLVSVLCPVQQDRHAAAVEPIQSAASAGSWTSSRSCGHLLSSNRSLIYRRPCPSLCLLAGETMSAALRSALRSRPCAAPRHLGGVLQKSLTTERPESVVSALVSAGDVPGPFDHRLRRAIQEDQFGVEFLFQLQFPGFTHLQHTRLYYVDELDAETTRLFVSKSKLIIRPQIRFQK